MNRKFYISHIIQLCEKRIEKLELQIEEIKKEESYFDSNYYQISCKNSDIKWFQSIIEFCNPMNGKEVVDVDVETYKRIKGD